MTCPHSKLKRLKFCETCGSSLYLELHTQYRAIVRDQLNKINLLSDQPFDSREEAVIYYTNHPKGYSFVRLLLEVPELFMYKEKYVHR